MKDSPLEWFYQSNILPLPQNLSSMRAGLVFTLFHGGCSLSKYKKAEVRRGLPPEGGSERWPVLDLSPGFWELPTILGILLACGGLVPVSASVFPWPSSRCVSSLHHPPSLHRLLCPNFLLEEPLSCWIRKSKSVSRPVVSSSLQTPLDCSLPGSSVHGILQTTILE